MNIPKPRLIKLATVIAVRAFKLAMKHPEVLAVVGANPAVVLAARIVGMKNGSRKG